MIRQGLSAKTRYTTFQEGDAIKTHVRTRVYEDAQGTYDIALTVNALEAVATQETTERVMKLKYMTPSSWRQVSVVC